MALVDSLLTAMVRANGDALVMHVGERPYVVRESGTIDLSNQALNLDAMTGMLAQLLPGDAQGTLQEFGAVEHQLPAKDDDRFTVVAARGGDDIWIEIRRRRKPIPVADAIAADISESVAEIPEPVMVTAVMDTAVMEAPAMEAPVAEAPAMEAPAIESPLMAAAPITEAPNAEASNAEEPFAVPELLVEAVAAAIPELEAPPILETPQPLEEAPVAEMVALPQDWPAAEIPSPVQEPVVVEEPLVVQEPLMVDEPVVMAEQAVVEEPVSIVEPLAIEQPIAVETPIAPDLPEPMVAEEHAAVPDPPAIEEPAPAEAVVAEAPTIVEDVQEEPAVAEAPPPIEVPAFVAVAAAEQASIAPSPAPTPYALESVVLPMTRTVRIEVPPHNPSSRTAGVERLLRLAASRGASALYLTSDSKPYLRVEGDIRILEDENVLTKADVEAAALEIVPPNAQELVRKREATEWIAELPELGRIRCTSFQDHRGPGVLFRMIATRAATAEQLGLSREVQALATEAEGLVLVAGSRGAGKSTLISALVDLVNRQRADHVITLERQIRLVHDNRTALVSQREIRGGADEALAAARAALRENPDVLVVDDLSSAHMVPLLVEAAGQGLLVLVSITAPSTADAVERFIDLAPPEMRAAVQAGMSETFRGAVAQALLKKTGGGRVTAREVLLGTASVTRLIADGQLAQLPLALESGRKYGMMPMTDTLLSFVQSGVVDAREAFRKANDRDRLVSGLKRAGIDTSTVERLA